jgi:IS4 transposase
LAQKVSATSENAIKFLVACNGQAKGIQRAKAYARKHPECWVQYKKGSDEILVMNFTQIQLFEKDKNSLVRLVLVNMTQQVKKCKKNKVRYHAKTRIYAIATNLRQGYGPRQIFKKYQQRQTIELMFRELKNAFTVGKLPSNEQYANYAYFLLCCLAYNASSYFKRDALPAQHKNSSMATIRRKFLEIPANRLDVWDIEFNRNYQYLKEYEHIVKNVHMLISDANHATAAA